MTLGVGAGFVVGLMVGWSLAVSIGMIDAFVYGRGREPRDR